MLNDNNRKHSESKYGFNKRGKKTNVYTSCLTLIVVVALLAGCVTTKPQKSRQVNNVYEGSQQVLPHLPKDADLTQIQEQLRLFRSERYLTKNGEIKVIPSDYEHIHWNGIIEKVKVEDYTQEEEGRIVIPVGSD
ncbi:hypothetical protein GKC30_14775 [Pseudodesulfovibrio sp. F-1]|uniref:Uncharacterized protein n=1 Tax=Pseudodesulfovibrio alkaliphilus TaxID=2661613 RepID=A0A7K1KSF7_9BACT|nr:hypothetical protein [Pseudodesulfovibrio alkaliphilus]MUM78890.1 hypothetical protein [Pseudodesulfovibrio alkaliphilus]